MPEDWSREEVEATVADYLDMLDQELRGRPLNKSAHRRILAQQLRNRSDPAIERKHQNISAVLIHLGFVYVEGYKPLGNYQRILLDVVSERLAGAPALRELVAAEVSAPAPPLDVRDILGARVDPPRPDDDRRGYRPDVVREDWPTRPGIDYLAREAANQSLGGAGEEFVVQFERARLREAGAERLADRVERVSLTRGDGEGFDVLSFEESGEERLIEVKTTAYGAFTPFYVTPNEVRVSNARPEQYHLYRAFAFRANPRLFVKPGPIDQSFRLRPSQFVAALS